MLASITSVINTCIDNIVSSFNPDHCTGLIMGSGLSDHAAQYLVISCKKIVAGSELLVTHLDR